MEKAVQCQKGKEFLKKLDICVPKYNTQQQISSEFHKLIRQTCNYNNVIHNQCDFL